MREGDIITVLMEDKSGWWKGSLGGKVGLFPSNFTQPVDAAGAMRAMASTQQVVSKAREAAPDLVVARHEYHGSPQDDELSFESGDMITVLKRDPVQSLSHLCFLLK